LSPRPTSRPRPGNPAGLSPSNAASSSRVAGSPRRAHNSRPVKGPQRPPLDAPRDCRGIFLACPSLCRSFPQENTMNAVQARPTGVISELALARAQRNTVLIIDDLFSSRLLLAEIVRQIDGKLNLELFDTPSRAQEFARENRVDLILTDYKLPEFDGIELVRRLRRLPHCVD